MPDQHGPQRTGEFVVEFDDKAVAGWKSVSIPAVSIEQGEYREGNQSAQEKTVAGEPVYEDLEMDRGVQPSDTTLWDWVNAIRQGKVDDSLRDIEVSIQDKEGNTLVRWRFIECWPKEYHPPNVDSRGGDAGARERLSVGFDQMSLVSVMTLCGKRVPTLTKIFNDAAGDIPSLIERLVSDERIHLIVNRDSNRDYTVVTNSNTRIESFEDSKPEEPSLEVETNCQTISAMASADNPKSAALEAYENGAIDIRGIAFLTATAS